jgi:hypothetical protein
MLASNSRFGACLPLPFPLKGGNRKCGRRLPHNRKTIGRQSEVRKTPGRSFEDPQRRARNDQVDRAVHISTRLRVKRSAAGITLVRCSDASKWATSMGQLSGGGAS